MRKYIAEVIGTFALVFCGTGAIIINQESSGAITHVGIAFTFGLIVMVMIYALGPVSGAHLNPAVTIAFTFAKRFQAKEIVPYILSQCIGAVLASGTLHFLFPTNVLLGSTMPAGAELQSFILELILTFFLMLVIIHVATGSKEQGMFAGPICGASMNPVRSFAPAIVSGHLEHLWIYLVAPIVGAVMAIGVWLFLKEPEIIKV